MIHPTRLELLQLRERLASIANSVAILKARRQALIRALLGSARPLSRSREAIRRDYRQAIVELCLSEGHEGTACVESLAANAEREVGVDVTERNALGVRYRDLTAYGPFVRSPLERGHGYTATTPHLDECVHRFESILAELLEVAAVENKVETLGEEVLRVTRRTRMLDERVLPRLRAEVRAIQQYLGERERESQFRLRRFKRARTARAGAYVGEPYGGSRQRRSDAAAVTGPAASGLSGAS